MSFEEIEEAKMKARKQNLSLDEQCKIAAKFIKENNIKTVKRSKNAKSVSKRK